MANICWFEMRVRGTQENCYALLDSGLQYDDAYVAAENGTDDDYMVYVSGNCRWSLTSSMMNESKGETLALKAQKYNVELEACGLSEDGGCEHFHYKGSQVIKENNLAPYYTIMEMEEVELSPEELAKYQKIEDQGIYSLKEEFRENFMFDEEQGKAVFDFEMSFRDLPGFEDYEESNANEENWDEDCDAAGMDEETLREVFGIVPDENGFAFKDEDGCTTLYNYFGAETVISVPKNINELAAGCFAGNEIIEEVTLPSSVEALDMCCFKNCPNLRKVYITKELTVFGCDDSTFSNCPNLTIYAPAGSPAEEYAKENSIPFVAKQVEENTTEEICNENESVEDLPLPTQSKDTKSAPQMNIDNQDEFLNEQNKKIDEIRRAAKNNEEAIEAILKDFKSSHRRIANDFKHATQEIEKLTSKPIDVYNDDVNGIILEVIERATMACKARCMGCQGIVILLDKTCKHLVTEGMSYDIINKVYKEIKSLNSDSKIDNNYGGTFNGVSLGDVGTIHFEPSKTAKKIERWWKSAAKQQLEINQKFDFLKENQILENDYEKNKNYSDACHKLECAKTVKDVEKAREIFISLAEFLDSSKFVEKCDEKISRITAEEQAAKAEAERIRKEEERLAEEEKNKEKNAKEHMDNIVLECRSMVDEFKKKLNLALENYEMDLKGQLVSKLDELTKQKSDNDQYLQGLGFFNFAEKKEAKNKDLQLSSKIRQLSSPSWIENQISNVKKAFDEALNKYSANVEKHLKSRFPDLAPKPVKYNFPDSTQGCRLRILYTLTTSDAKTLGEIIDSCGFEPSTIISPMVTYLCAEGMVKKSEIKGKTYYSLTCSKESVLRMLPVIPQPAPTYKEVEKYANRGCPQPPEIESIKLPEIDI